MSSIQFKLGKSANEKSAMKFSLGSKAASSTSQPQKGFAIKKPSAPNAADKKKPKISLFSHSDHESDNEEEKFGKREEITSMADGTLIELHKKPEKQKLVIPLRSVEIQEETQEADAQKTDLKDKNIANERQYSKTTFGLQVMSSGGEKASASGKSTDRPQTSILARAALMNARLKAEEEENPQKTVERIEAVQLDTESYERVPVEEFGKALLRGMGWKDEEEEEEGTDSKGKKSSSFFDPQIRPALLGLGADPRLAVHKVEGKPRYHHHKSSAPSSSSSRPPNSNASSSSQHRFKPY